jgi:hypothetical protein
MLPPRGERKISLRQAFVEQGNETTMLNEDANESELTITRESDEVLQEPQVSSAIAAAENNPKLLFSTAAEPLLSTDDAVAMRNSACLDLVSADDMNILSHPSEQTTRGMRKMRSVDALQLALERMRVNASAVHQTNVQATIPESTSAESIRAEDFANARTTHEEDGASITRCPTPTLVITSPTGVRPPQPLILDGVEFEPWSVSPDAKRNSSLVRPTPQRTAWKLRRRPSSIHSVTDGDALPSTVATPAVQVDGMGDGANAIKTAERLKAPRLRKRSRSRSSGSLRDVGQTSSQPNILASSIGTLSGSAQIRALQRDVLSRSQATSSSRSRQTDRTSVSPSPPAPLPLALHGEDDPFTDFSTLHKNQRGSKPASVLGGRASIDRSKMSPVPFERQSRSPSPLGENRSLVNASRAAALQFSHTMNGSQDKNKAGKAVGKVHRPLPYKKSGVGLACLVDLGQHRNGQHASASDRQKNTQALADNDENAFPPLDSPTTTAAVKRLRRKHSTTMQGQAAVTSSS